MMTSFKDFKASPPAPGTRILAFSPVYPKGDPMRFRLVTVLPCAMLEIASYMLEEDLESVVVSEQAQEPVVAESGVEKQGRYRIKVKGGDWHFSNTLPSGMDLDAIEAIEESGLAGASMERPHDLASYPNKCPITRRPFFMTLEHPELGLVPTYGGPFDSFTIPHMLGEASEQMHERELEVHRYDHDRGSWVDDETIPLRVIHDKFLENVEMDRKSDPRAALSVWFGSMPESNGKSNWTAILHGGDMTEGFTIARSEYKDRVRYDADCVRHLIGELEKRPFILDYDGDLTEAVTISPEVEEAVTDTAADASQTR